MIIVGTFVIKNVEEGKLNSTWWSENDEFGYWATTWERIKRMNIFHAYLLSVLMCFYGRKVEVIEISRWHL